MLPPLQTHRRPAQIHRQPDRTISGRRRRHGRRRLRRGNRHGPRRRRHHGPRHQLRGSRHRRRCGHQPVPPRRHRDRRRNRWLSAGQNTSQRRHPPTPRHHDRRRPGRVGGIRHAPVGQGRGSRVCGSRLRLTGRRVRGRHDSVRCIRHKTIATSALCPRGRDGRPVSRGPRLRLRRGPFRLSRAWAGASRSVGSGGSIGLGRSCPRLRRAPAPRVPSGVHRLNRFQRGRYLRYDWP